MVPNPQTQGRRPRGFATVVAGGASDVLPKPPFPIQRWLLMKKKRRKSRNIQRLEIGERRWFRKFRFFFFL
jgi:hypothetical protein